MPPTFAPLAGFILALAAPHASAQGALEALQSYGVQEIEAPSRENPWKADEWREKYRAYWPIHVAVKNGELALSRWTGKEQRHFGQSYRASGIEYVGTNRGEFGGGLVAVLPGGGQRRLLEENIVALVPRGSALRVVSGLAHGDSSAGAIHTIDRAHSDPRVRLLTLLPDAPRVVLEGPDPAQKRIYLVGPSSLMSFGGYGSQERLVIHAWGPHWAGLHPNSAVFYRNHLIIGAQNCLVLVELAHGEVVRTRYFQQTAADRLRR